MPNLEEICQWLMLPPGTPPAALAEECRKRLDNNEDLYRKAQGTKSKSNLKAKSDAYREKLAVIQRALDSEKAAGLLEEFKKALAENRKAGVARIHEELGRIPKDSFTQEQCDKLGRLVADALDAGIKLRQIDFAAPPQVEPPPPPTPPPPAPPPPPEPPPAKPKTPEPVTIPTPPTIEDDAAIAGRTTIQTDGRLRIPRAFLNNVQPGGRLTLVPTEPGAAAILLVSRDEFKLGRGDPEVDFVTWFLPRSKENDTKTRHLSKVHVIARIEDGQPCLRDNSGNGAHFDNEPVTQVGWDPVAKRGVLRLGAEYLLDVQPVAPASAKDPDIANIRSWSGPSARKNGPRGCLRFSPPSGPAKRDALWLFSDAAFGSGPKNPIVINNAELAEVQGRFYFYRDCFWVENVVKEGGVLVNDTALKPGEIAPLVSGQTLRLGKAGYKLEVSA